MWVATLARVYTYVPNEMRNLSSLENAILVTACACSVNTYTTYGGGRYIMVVYTYLYYYTFEHFFEDSFQILISQGVELWAWLELANTFPSP